MKYYKSTVFNNTPRRKRSHGHFSYNKPIIHDVTSYSLVPYVNTPLGLHLTHRTKFYSVPSKIVYDLHEKVKASSYLDSTTPEYRLVYVAHHRIFDPRRIIDECELTKPRKLLHNLTTKELMLSTLTSSTIKRTVLYSALL
jgi:hypothetical protein